MFFAYSRAFAARLSIPRGFWVPVISPLCALPGKGGAKVEKSHPAKAAWQRSSYCGATGACVEVAMLDDNTVAMRSSNQPARCLILARSEWISFVRGIRDGHSFTMSSMSEAESSGDSAIA
ncbi:DUF397 domain-containing protein [Nonomuraea guangzhouensis]|uniref:DUF397 domain-containing protein n=1 Tax=Nonomuraea guangzhouensis TaxID=1291555 RepID=A0ABW4FZK9_9ACTN